MSGRLHSSSHGPAPEHAVFDLVMVVLALTALGIAFALLASTHDSRPDYRRLLERGASRRGGGAGGVSIGWSPGGAYFVQSVGGLAGPESVRYDAEQDAYLVSNMAGAGSDRDGNGYIVRIPAADAKGATVLVQGGMNGAVLDAPKGMAIHGDTLWVADITRLVGFDRRSGAPLATVDFGAKGAVMLNDVAVGPDGAIRVTDTGIRMTYWGVIHTGPDRVFELGAGGAIREVGGETPVPLPNGITWDAVGRRWLVGSFDPFVGEVAVLGDSGRRSPLWRGAGRVDGIEVLGDGRVVFTTWQDSTVHVLEGGRDRPLLRQMPEPADLGVDTRRGRIAVPLSVLGIVQIWGVDRPGARPRE